jgi:hypothetical protein
VRRLRGKAGPEEEARGNGTQAPADEAGQAAPAGAAE